MCACSGKYIGIFVGTIKNALAHKLAWTSVVQNHETFLQNLIYIHICS